MKVGPCFRMTDWQNSPVYTDLAAVRKAPAERPARSSRCYSKPETNTCVLANLLRFAGILVGTGPEIPLEKKILVGIGPEISSEKKVPFLLSRHGDKMAKRVFSNAVQSGS